jgi:hypothetical protein
MLVGFTRAVLHKFTLLVVDARYLTKRLRSGPFAGVHSVKCGGLFPHFILWVLKMERDGENEKGVRNCQREGKTGARVSGRAGSINQYSQVKGSMQLIK